MKNLLFKICITLMTLIINGRAGEDKIFKQTYLFECNITRCDQVSVTKTDDKVLLPRYKSLELCQTLCGPYGGLWPRPHRVTLGDTTVILHPDYIDYKLMGKTSAECNEILLNMWSLAIKNIRLECDGSKQLTEYKYATVHVIITLTNDSLAFDWYTPENYSLSILTKDNKVTVNIKAPNLYGVRHALETFTQLFAREDITDEKECILHLVKSAEIQDKPKYTHRGLVLDTSRHFMPISSIKRTMDGMAAAKLNVFHWHATDSHSFPLQSRRVPQFTEYGAYSNEEIYTVDEIEEVIKYAQIRGIRVVIEIDAPAHAGNGWQWGKEYQEEDLAVCVNKQPWRDYCVQPPCGQLDPVNPRVYHYLKELYKDILDMVPEPVLFHMGGDEVFLDCWKSVDHIADYVRRYYYDDFMKLWAEFHQKSLENWDEAVRERNSNAKQESVIIWSSHLTQPDTVGYLDKNRYVIEVWEPVNSTLLSALLQKGYRVISVPKDVWYLDHGLWGTTHRSNWRKMYDHTVPYHKNLLGGEVAMWSEYVDDLSLDTHVWPRAAAVAERLWTNEGRSSQAVQRLERLRTRLISRGLRPEAMHPEWCTRHNRCD